MRDQLTLGDVATVFGPHVYSHTQGRLPSEVPAAVASSLAPTTNMGDWIAKRQNVDTGLASWGPTRDWLQGKSRTSLETAVLKKTIVAEAATGKTPGSRHVNRTALQVG